ncbi:MAG TPA: hypothetical protein VFL91_09715 [Thermomicrobiales bacterium]|nr:hypothetical protein [Thermomicrobiales bacterium]
MDRPAYDVATLERARHGVPLHLAHGLAITRGWVARAACGEHGDPRGDWGPAGAAAYQPPLPGHRAAMQALLDDCQRWLEAHPDAAQRALVRRRRGADGAAADQLWLCDAAGAFRIGIAPAHAALIARGDRLMAVRRYQRSYVLVVRAGTVMAVLKGRLEATLLDGAALPLQVRPAESRRSA